MKLYNEGRVKVVDNTQLQIWLFFNMLKGYRYCGLHATANKVTLFWRASFLPRVYFCFSSLFFYTILLKISRKSLHAKQNLIFLIHLFDTGKLYTINLKMEYIVHRDFLHFWREFVRNIELDVMFVIWSFSDSWWISLFVTVFTTEKLWIWGESRPAADFGYTRKT